MLSQSLASCGALRTLGSLTDSFQVFGESRANIKKAKIFDNVVQATIITGPPNSLDLELISPMELHLLLGVVNQLYKTMEEHWPQSTHWSAPLHIKEEPYHRGHSAGNECHKLLNNLDILQHFVRLELFCSISHFKCWEKMNY